jgi:hypothetical protein
LHERQCDDVPPKQSIQLGWQSSHTRVVRSKNDPSEHAVIQLELDDHGLTEDTDLELQIKQRYAFTVRPSTRSHFMTLLTTIPLITEPPEPIIISFIKPMKESYAINSPGVAVLTMIPPMYVL